MVDLRFLCDQARLGERAGLSQRRGIYLALREAIADGRLPAGSVLPATRALACELSLARNSLIYAYEQLAAEGYVQATRQGTVVRAWARASLAQALAGDAKAGQETRSHGQTSLRAGAWQRSRTPDDDLKPFMPGVPAMDALPLQAWRKAMDRAARCLGGADLGYRDARGEPELRQAIATYVQASRGVRCHADQVVVTHGTQDSLNLCAQLLADVGDLAWIEHPGYGGARVALSLAGLQLQPITVDAEGMAVPPAWWHERPPRLIYLTPSHQYPLGSVLTWPRRMSLIDGARRCGAWILEDDYDSEFRHDGPPLAAMQGLVDDAPVVYLGTFSKSLFPALRLGYMVLPQALADRLAPSINALVRGGRPQSQLALAEFINEGEFTRHLRRMRRLYWERQQALREAWRVHWPWPSALLGGECGMHLTVAGCPLSDHVLADEALNQGLSPRPLSAYSTGGVEGFEGLVLGYANLPAEDMARYVAHLARVTSGLLRASSTEKTAHHRPADQRSHPS